MNNKTRIITLSALLSALTVALLYFGSIWPTGQLGFAAFASLFAAAAVIELGIRSGIYIYIISSALGMLILPDKSAPFLYLLFFGYFPVVKSLVERIGNSILQWVIKLAFFNAALTVIWFILREVIFSSINFDPGDILLYLGGNIVFVLFDYGYSKVIWYYMHNVSKNINRRK